MLKSFRIASFTAVLLTGTAGLALAQTGGAAGGAGGTSGTGGASSYSIPSTGSTSGGAGYERHWS